jgi:hypothetical protein
VSTTLKNANFDLLNKNEAYSAVLAALKWLVALGMRTTWDMINETTNGLRRRPGGERGFGIVR